MSDTAPDTDQLIDEAPDTGASLVPEADVAAEAPEAPAPAAQFPWSAEHPEWGVDDIHKAYSEARSFISRGEHQQPQAPAPEEPAYDPYTELPAGDDPALVQDLADIFAGQKTFEGGTYGPQAVMEWLAKSNALSEPTRGRFLQAWAEQNNWAAQTWVARHAYSSEREAMREELRQEYAPAIQHAETTLNQTAISIAAQQLPDFEEKWMPSIVEYVDKENPGVFKGLATAEQKAQRIIDIVFLLSGREQHAQRLRAAQPAPQPAAAAAVTQTTSRAPNGQFTAREQHRKDVLDSLRTLKV